MPNQNRNHRLAPHNSARQTGAKARAGRSLDQAVPWQAAPDQAAPEQSQDTHRGKHQPQLRQADRCHGKRRALARPCGARPSGARASARHPPGQAPAEQIPIKAIAGHPPGQAPAEHTHQTKQHQTKRRQGIQTEIASLNGDRRFQLQRSGAISSGPLKKLRVSCVHERDGKQVPCVRSLCSYARESRAC